MQMPPPQWQPPAPPPKKRLPVALIVGIILLPLLCCPIFAAVLFPVFAQARLAAIHATNVRRMAAIAIGVRQFAEAHQGKLPPMGSYRDFEFSMRPYSPETVRGVYTRDARGRPFKLNVALSNQPLNAFKSPASVPVVEEPVLSMGYRKVAIAFLDGHTTSYGSSAEAEQAWRQGILNP